MDFLGETKSVSLINRAKLLQTDPLYFVDEYYSKKRNEIDICRDEALMYIHDKYERHLKELKEIEQDCMTNLDHINTTKLNNLIFKQTLCEQSPTIRNCQELELESNSYLSDLITSDKYVCIKNTQSTSLLFDLVSNAKFSLAHNVTHSHFYGEYNTFSTHVLVEYYLPNTFDDRLIYRSDQFLSIYDSKTGVLLHNFSKFVNHSRCTIDFANKMPDNLLIAFFEGTPSLCVWNTETGQLIADFVLNLPWDANEILLLPDFKMFWGHWSGDNIIQNYKYKEKIFELQTSSSNHDTDMNEETILLSNNTIAIVTCLKIVYIWDWKTGIVVHKLNTKTQLDIRKMIYSNDFLIAGTKHGNVLFWNFTSGLLIRDVKLHASVVLVLVAVPRDLIASMDKDSLVISDIFSGAVYHKVQSSSLSSHFQFLKLHPNGNLAVCAMHQTQHNIYIYIIYPNTGKIIQTIWVSDMSSINRDPIETINSFEILYNGDLVSVSNFGRIRIWSC